ncbi:Uncharacterised protein [Mannheimia haemolytica]|uniref:Uncharacterized protein n=1 Tax=Mannheimia haemolytica TaxID=75985 RepID=A0A378MS28_MANHA|nr:Uncharacterised protein [Mannheimia haemolytica]
MFFLDNLKQKCTLNIYFPKTGLFLIDELKELFKYSKPENLNLLNENRIFSCIINSLERLKMEKLIKLAREETNKDPIFNGVFFDDNNSPINHNIENYFSDKGYSESTLSEVFVSVVMHTGFNKKSPFCGFKGYELAGAIALFYITKSFKSVDRSYQAHTTSKRLNSLSKRIKANSILSAELCLQASEAVILAQELKFKHREKNLIETAKYLINKTKQNAIIETTEKVTKEVKHLAIKENAQKALKIRHRANNETKEQLLKAYDEYAKNMLENGMVPNKNQFAKDNAEKFGMSECTIRNNWLKGYHPQI